MNLRSYEQNGPLPGGIDPDKRRVYEARIREAERVIAETKAKLEKFAEPTTLQGGLPRNTQLFLPLGDLRIASDGNLYVHPFSFLENSNRPRAGVMLVRVRSNNTLEVTISRNAPLNFTPLTDEQRKGWNKVTKFIRE